MTSSVKSSADEDLSGKNRIIWNTLVSWASHLVLVVSGFIMPRLVDGYVGQVQLGIWDFCWAFVSYLTLVDLGVGASSNRYIAKYRAEDKPDALNRVVSSAVTIEIFICLVIVTGTFAIVCSMPIFFADKLGESLAQTQSVMIYLGISLAITTLFSTSRGLLTGFHRWDLHNGLTAGSSLVSLALMMTLLVSGFEIAGMALGYLLATILFEFIRVFVTMKYCNNISASLSLVSKRTCLELLGFSAKGQLLVLPAVILLQSVNLLIFSLLGPAVLAIFARPLALTRHISTFMMKFTMILTPAAGAMLGKDKEDELKTFFLMTTKFSFASTLPLVIGLALWGDLIIELWMGANYVDWLLIATLSIGALLPTAQDCALRIMIAKNVHGKLSVYMTLVVIVSFLVVFTFLSGNEFTLITAACLLLIPSNLAYGITLPVYACKKLGISLPYYLKTSVSKPLLAVLPFSGLVMLAKYCYLEQAYAVAVVVLFLSVVSLLVLYGLLLLEEPQKIHLLAKLKFKKHGYQSLDGIDR